MDVLFGISSIVIFFLFFCITSFLVFVTFRLRYKTASSNQALVITGPNLGNPEKDKTIFTDENGRSLKVVRGGGYRLRFFQTSTPVPLNSFQIKLVTPKVYTKESVPVIAEAIASVKTADTLEGIANYAEQYLGKKQEEIETEVTKVLGTNLRAILAKLSVEEINNDREAFNDAVKAIAQKELDNMGFKITSLGLDDLKDANESEEDGYLKNLGRPRIVEIRKLADMAESDAEKETRIYRAKNDQEAQDEENRRQTEVAASKKQKDIKEAEFLEETERARAKSEQAYEIEKAKLAKEVTEETLKREMLQKQGAFEIEKEETKIKREKADVLAYEIQAKAKAEAETSVIAGQAQAAIEEAEGLAKAKVILELGKAEAEAKELMAAAMEKLGEAYILELFIKALPEFAEKVSLPLSAINEMKIIDMGGNESSGGASKVVKNVTQSMLGIQEALKETTGVDMKALMESYVSRGAVNNFASSENTDSLLPGPDTHSGAAE